MDGMGWIGWDAMGSGAKRDVTITGYNQMGWVGMGFDMFR